MILEYPFYLTIKASCLFVIIMTKSKTGSPCTKKPQLGWLIIQNTVSLKKEPLRTDSRGPRRLVLSQPIVSLLLCTVMGPDHHVAVGCAAPSGRLGFVPAHLRPARWSTPSTGVVLLQVAWKGLPASANTHHHMTLVEHLRKTKQRPAVKERRRNYFLPFWPHLSPSWGMGFFFFFLIIWKSNHFLCSHTHAGSNLIFTSFPDLAMKGKWALEKLCQNLIKPNETTPRGAPAEHTRAAQAHIWTRLRTHARTHAPVAVWRTKACTRRSAT